MDHDMKKEVNSAFSESAYRKEVFKFPPVIALYNSYILKANQRLGSSEYCERFKSFDKYAFVRSDIDCSMEDPLPSDAVL